MIASHQRHPSSAPNHRQKSLQLNVGSEVQLRVHAPAGIGFSGAPTADGLRVPLRSARSFRIANSTGNRINTAIEEVTIPPTIGTAIGSITSLPIPLSRKIGARLSITTKTVISLGRSRWTAPSMVAASISG